MGAKEKILEKAQGFAMKGYLDKAIAEYKNAIAIDSKDISLRLKLGDLYVKVGNKTDAVAEYKEVAKTHSQKGFYLKAIAVYKQILKIEEANFDVHYKLAELYARQKLTSDAISEYSILVNSFEKKGKTGEVMQLLKEMLDIDPENTTVRLKLAQLYQKLNFEKDALAEYAVIFDKYMAQSKLDKAEKLYQGLYATTPKDTGVLKGLAVLSIKRGDGAKFLKYAKPLFHIYRESGDAENAKSMSEAIIDVDPKDEECLSYLGKGPAHKEEEPLISISFEAEKPAAKEPAPRPKEPEHGEEEPLISWPEEGVEIGVEAGEKKEEPAPHVEAAEVEEHIVHEAVEVEVQPPAEPSADEVEIEIAVPGETVEAGKPEEEIEEAGELEGEAIEIATPAGEMSQSEIDALMGTEAPAAAEKEARPAPEEHLHIEVEVEGVEHGHIEGAEKAAVSHEDLSKSITELTEHAEPDEVISDVLLEVEEIEEAEPAPVEAKKARRERREDYVDLSAELGMEDALKDLAGSWGAAKAPSGEEAAAEAAKEDSETHFNLGIAYMEMEMHGEAVKEFNIAMKDPKLEFECYTRLGLCAMADRNFDEAISNYVKGLKVPGRTDDERKGMMYELALVYEAANKKDEASKLFAAIHSIDPDYREAALKVRLHAEAAVKIPKDDGLIEVELL